MVKLCCPDVVKLSGSEVVLWVLTVVNGDSNKDWSLIGRKLAEFSLDIASVLWSLDEALCAPEVDVLAERSSLVALSIEPPLLVLSVLSLAR